MPQVNRATRVAGGWLAVGSLLMILVLVIHGPISPDLGEQMRRVADGVMRWRVAHWLAAAGLSLYAVSGLLVLTAGSRLTTSGPTMTAWAVVVVGALWTLTTAVAEGTVVAGAAASGASDTFAAWWAFAEGKATGFAFVALAVAAIAGSEARSVERVGPAWAAWGAVLASVASFGGWAVGMWLGVMPATLVWVVASILMSAWTLSLGVGLMGAGAASGGPPPGGGSSGNQ